MKISIRKLSKEDRDAAAVVMKEAFNHIGQDWTDKGSLQYIKDHLKKSEHNLIACTEKKKVVGFIFAKNFSEGIWVDAIGTSPDFMNKGIALKLWNELKTIAEKENIKIIRMNTDPNSLAYKWYKRLGFKETGWVEMDLKIKE